MDSAKEKRFNSAHSPPTRIIRDLLSAIGAPEGLKPPLLKGLYCLLVHLTSRPLIYGSKFGADSNYFEMEFSQNPISVTFRDICSLSDLLFKELYKRFEQLLSTLLDVSTDQAPGRATLLSDLLTAADELNLLLRCCMVILNLLVPEQQLLLKNGQVLLAMLRKLCALNLNGGHAENAISFEKLVSCEYKFGDNGDATSFREDFVASLCFLQQSNPCIPFILTMLEVFVDELLLHGQLREYFSLIDSVSSSCEMLFMHYISHGNIGCVMEVISTHFFLSFSNEQAFENFLNRLFWPCGKEFWPSELSLTAAVSLLLNPIILSGPKIFQAHLVSLVSEGIGIGMSLENMRPDIRLINCYLSAFERSVILYTKHMSGLLMGSHYTGAEGCYSKSRIFGGDTQPCFESFIQPVTRNKINRLITKLDKSWHSHLRNVFFRTKSDLGTSSIAYVKESQFVLDVSCRDEILSILSSIILEALSDGNKDTALPADGIHSPQDICLLASILKLMNSSLSQIIWCLRNIGDLDNLRTLKSFSSCKEYDSVVGIISCFQQFNMPRPIQKLLYDIMELHSTKHKESKLMLIHFSGLLSLSFVSGFDFLVKGCISAVMTLMNLFIFEEGNIGALRSLHHCKWDTSLTALPPNTMQKAVLDQSSCLVVASKFKKIQTMYLSAPPLAIGSARREDVQTNTSADSTIANNRECVVGMEEETEEICNGKIFLNCILECPNSSDIDDLADFIECKQGKDYSAWLRDRRRYRKWKCDKMAGLRWEKKKKTWKYIKGKRA